MHFWSHLITVDQQCHIWQGTAARQHVGFSKSTKFHSAHLQLALTQSFMWYGNSGLFKSINSLYRARSINLTINKRNLMCSLSWEYSALLHNKTRFKLTWLDFVKPFRKPQNLLAIPQYFRHTRMCDQIQNISSWEHTNKYGTLTHQISPWNL